MPALSIIMPCRNHARYLPEALIAIFAQSPAADELLFLDDASEDGSLAILQEYAQYAQHGMGITVRRHDSRRGVSASMNEGLRSASGDYVYFAAADDRVLPGLFSRSLAMLRDHPSAGLCSSLIRLIGPSGEDLGEPTWSGPDPSDVFLSPADVLTHLMVFGPWFNGNATIWSREALLAVGGFREVLGPYCDGFAAQAVALHAGACYLHKPLACWRQLPQGYAASTARNPEETRRMYEAAHAIMAGELAHLFPPAYRDLWRSRVRLESR